MGIWREGPMEGNIMVPMVCLKCRSGSGGLEESLGLYL